MMETAPIPFVATASPDRNASGLIQARALEAAFLAEMLSHAGLGKTDGPFSGGAGEAQFSSFLRHEQSRLMVEAGGLGLAETIFRAMNRKGLDDGT